jgi:hypothetical protein
VHAAKATAAVPAKNLDLIVYLRSAEFHLFRIRSESLDRAAVPLIGGVELLFLERVNALSHARVILVPNCLSNHGALPAKKARHLTAAVFPSVPFPTHYKNLIQ